MTKVEIQLATIECCRCGITFGVPELFERTRRSDHQLFYCPAGHNQYFGGKSEAERLREILEAERQSYARARENLRRTGCDTRNTISPRPRAS